MTVQQAVEVLRQDPEITKLVSGLKNADKKTKIGLIQRLKNILAPLIILSVGTIMIALMIRQDHLDRQLFALAKAYCLDRVDRGQCHCEIGTGFFGSGNYSCH